MTTDQKFKAILERCKATDPRIEPPMISLMVIVYYLNQLQKIGIIESSFQLTPTGLVVAEICNEFDWKPKDTDIFEFVNEMVEKEERLMFALILKKYRDGRDELLADFEKSKQDQKSKDGH
jgi:hypothetical protein